MAGIMGSRRVAFLLGTATSAVVLGMMAPVGAAPAPVVFDCHGQTANEQAYKTPPNQVGDDHPSGRSRETEAAGSGTQGRSNSDPDGTTNAGADKPGCPGGFDSDQDGNNGCGNDDDFEDDNNGWCGRQRDAAPAAGATPTNGLPTTSAPGGDQSGGVKKGRRAVIAPAAPETSVRGTAVSVPEPLGGSPANDEPAGPPAPTATFTVSGEVPPSGSAAERSDGTSGRATGVEIGTSRTGLTGFLPRTGTSIAGLAGAGTLLLAAGRLLRHFRHNSPSPTGA